MNKIFCTYYELQNTVNEYNSIVNGRYSSFEAAKADMANHGDWYCPDGTGTIYEVTLTESKDNKLIYNRVQIYQV